jgi:hypothetical protein
MYDDTQKCTAEAVKGGLCQRHYDAQATKAEEAPAIPAQAMEWTDKKIKETFGALGNGVSDGTKGKYLGGGAGEAHVHIYGDGGAHVKVGNKAYKFLSKPDCNFMKDAWAEGVAEVKKRIAGDKGKLLLGAMAITLAGQANQKSVTKSEINTLISAL